MFCKFSLNLEGNILEGNEFGGKSFWRELGFRGKVLVCQNVLMVFYTKDYDHFTHFHFLLKFATQKVKIPSLKDYCLLAVSKDSFCHTTILFLMLL